MSSTSNTLDAQVTEKIDRGKKLHNRLLESKNSIKDYAKNSNFNLLLKNESTWKEASAWADAICKKVLQSPQQTDTKVFKSTVNSILIEYLNNIQKETKLSSPEDDDDEEVQLVLNSKSLYSSVLPNFIGVFLNLALLANYNKDENNIEVVFSIDRKTVDIELLKNETKAFEVEDERKSKVLKDMGLVDSSYQKLEEASIKFFQHFMQGGTLNSTRIAIKLGNHVLSAVIDNDDPQEGDECTFSMGSTFPEGYSSNWGGALRVKRSREPNDDQNDSPDVDSVDSDVASVDSVDSNDSDNSEDEDNWDGIDQLGGVFTSDDAATATGKQKKKKGADYLHHKVNIESLNERFYNFARSIPSKSLLRTMEFYETKNKSTRDYMRKLMSMPDDGENYDTLCSYVACKIILQECKIFWREDFLRNTAFSSWKERTEESGMPPFLFIRFLLYTQSENFKISKFNQGEKYLMSGDELRWGDVSAYEYLSDHITELKKQANLEDFFAFPLDLNEEPCPLAWWYKQASQKQKKDRTPAEADAVFFYENMKEIKKIQILALGIPVFKAYMSIMRGTRALNMAQLLTTTGAGAEDENFKEAFKEHMEYVLNPEEEDDIKEVREILAVTEDDTPMDENDEEVWKTYVDKSYTATKDLEQYQMLNWGEYEATRAFKYKVPLAIAELYSDKQRKKNSEMLRQKINDFFDLKDKDKGAKFWDTVRRTLEPDPASHYVELHEGTDETKRLKIYIKEVSETESDVRYNPRLFFLLLQEASQNIDQRFAYIIKNLKKAKNQEEDAAIKWMTFSNRSMIKTAIQSILDDNDGDFWHVPDGDTPVSESGQSYDNFMLSTFDEEQCWEAGHTFDQKKLIKAIFIGENTKKYKLAELIRYGVLQSLFLPAFRLVANGRSRLTDRHLQKDNTSQMIPELQREHSSKLATKAANYYNDAEQEGLVVTASNKKAKLNVDNAIFRKFFNKKSIIQYVLNREVTQNIRAMISGIAL